LKTNVLIDQEGNAFLADFGLSVALAEGDKSYYNSHSSGAVRWSAPELIGSPEPESDLDDNDSDFDFPKPNSQSDVFSLGCIMLHVSRVCQTLFEFYLNFASYRSSRASLPSGGLTMFNSYSMLSSGALSHIGSNPV
jgi:serine/threonine protein kinase